MVAPDALTSKLPLPDPQMLAEDTKLISGFWLMVMAMILDAFELQFPLVTTLLKYVVWVKLPGS